MVSRLAFDYFQAFLLAIAVAGFVLLRFRLGLAVTLVFGFGLWRGAVTDFPNTPVGRQMGRTVALSGIVADDPGRTANNQIGFKLSDVILNGAATGQDVQIYTPYKDMQRGYRVVASGKLKSRRGLVASQVSFARVVVVSDQVSLLDRLRQRFFTGVRGAMPEPVSGFGLGLLIGVRSLIDKDLQDVLTAVGLSHLIAVSGYNLTIIVHAIRRFSGMLSHFSVTALSLWLIGGFLIVTGFSAPIVRAALVSALGLLIVYYGYIVRPLVIIAVPAALTVAWKPDYLVRDVSWQLSFLAFVGVLVLAPLMEERWVRRPNAIKSLMIESTAAQILTAPLILGLFTNLSLVSPVSNVVILPLVPLAMLLSFITGLAAMASPLVGVWVALPGMGLLGMMIGLSQWFATWPYANINFQTSTNQVLLLYGLVAVFTASLYRWRAHHPEDVVAREYSPYDTKLG